MRVGMILSGCGFQDGSEIQEAVVAMLTLTEAGATVECLAPAGLQTSVIDHVTGAAARGERSVRSEAARIARGDVRPLADARPDDYAAIVLPGGFGVAKNLCDFAAKGAAMTVEASTAQFLRRSHELRLPIGALCIAPVLLAKLFPGARLTIGHDAATAAAVTAMGAVHVACAVEDCVTDETNRFVSTPAYMLDTNIKGIHAGIRRLTSELMRLAELPR